MATYKPFVNLGPGDTIREELEHYGWEQRDLADIMGMSEKHISHLVKNKVPVTYETACLLSKVFRQDPQFWLNLDASYRQRMEESAKVKETTAKALIYRYMPVRDLRKAVGLPRNVDGLVAAVKDFWHVPDLDFGFLERKAVCFRRSEAYANFNPYHALAWLQWARNSLADNLPAQPYDRKALAAVADRLSTYTVSQDGVTSFLADLRCCGVAFGQFDHFEHTYTDGAAFFEDHHPAILYTARHNRIDNFWFTMAHELGHVLLHEHDEGDVFIDSLENLDLSDRREKAADAFAGTCLKNDQILEAFASVQRTSVARIRSVAQSLGLHPGIVAGCLQHHNKAAWTSFHKLKPTIRDLLADSSANSASSREPE